MAKAHRIDVHFHPTPPGARRVDHPSAAPRNNWNLIRALEEMDKGSVATSILSIPHSAGMWAGKVEEGRQVARSWNSWCTSLCREYPGRFQVFATLPLLDIDGSLMEIEHAFDVLGAVGINMMTNIGDKWLGDPHYWPVFEELNRRKAIVYTHPIAPNCCAGIFPELADATIEFGTDTTRALAKLLFSGAASRFPNICFIFSHAGGTMPMLVERFEHAYKYSPEDLKARVPEGVREILKSYYYDTAQSAHRHAMSSLRELVPATQIVFGTDYPYRTSDEIAKGLRSCGFNDFELAAIESENAKRLGLGL